VQHRDVFYLCKNKVYTYYQTVDVAVTRCHVAGRFNRRSSGFEGANFVVTASKGGQSGQGASLWNFGSVKALSRIEVRETWETCDDQYSEVPLLCDASSWCDRQIVASTLFKLYG